jgi:ATP-dependent helicase HrpA
MTEQQKLTFPMLLQQLDSLMLRDKQRFARRLHGSRRLKILMHNRPFTRRWRKRLNRQQGKLCCEAARPDITYPENLPVSQKKQDILNAVRDHQVVIVAGETGSGKPPSCRKSAWSWGAV